MDTPQDTMTERRRAYHLRLLDEVRNDPDFAFDMLDGEKWCYINKKTGCVVFGDPTVALSPMNLLFILLFLERNPEAKAWLQDEMIPFLHPECGPRGLDDQGKTWKQILDERRAKKCPQCDEPTDGGQHCQQCVDGGIGR